MLLRISIALALVLIAINVFSKFPVFLLLLQVVPIFHVMMVLEKNNRVELQPTIQTLFDMIHKVSRELITAISCVPRLVKQALQKQMMDNTVSDHCCELQCKIPFFMVKSTGR